MDDKTLEILECLISQKRGFSELADLFSPLRAFDSNNKESPKIILKNKIKLINYLRGNKQSIINEKNFESYTKTDEYLKIIKRINEFNIVYERLLSEYNDWKKELAPYEKYVEDERKREEEIFQKKKNEFFREIFEQLPLVVKDFISNKEFDEQVQLVLGLHDISTQTNIEFFHHDEIEKLKSPSEGWGTRYLIVRWQSDYLKSLGITIPNKQMLECNSEEDINNYLSFLNREDIKKYIPNDEFINYISSIREKKYEEALKEYYTTRDDFIDAMKIFANNQHNLNYIYERIKNKEVCVSGVGAFNEKNEWLALMFYTVRGYFDGGYLLHTFMHECGHISDQGHSGRSGFDIMDENAERNPYDNKYRKYEKFNETIEDIFSIEAEKFLQSLGIYLIESKEITQLDASNRNTGLITKKLLQPLIKKFRKQVIKAKVNYNPQELIKYIGENNFEELVDTVNKVDYLWRKGVIYKIDEFPEDAMVIEYFEQVERVKKIYINIDDYYANKFEEHKLDDVIRKK